MLSIMLSTSDIANNEIPDRLAITKYSWVPHITIFNPMFPEYLTPPALPSLLAARRPTTDASPCSRLLPCDGRRASPHAAASALPLHLPTQVRLAAAGQASSPDLACEAKLGGRPGAAPRCYLAEAVGRWSFTPRSSLAVAGRRSISDPRGSLAVASRRPGSRAPTYVARGIVRGGDRATISTRASYLPSAAPRVGSADARPSSRSRSATSFFSLLLFV